MRNNIAGFGCQVKYYIGYYIGYLAKKNLQLHNSSVKAIFLELFVS
jgi:hypothetical protein